MSDRATRHEVGDSREASATRCIAALAFLNFVVVTSEFSVVGMLPAMAADLGISVQSSAYFVSVFAVSASLLGPVLSFYAQALEPRFFLLAAASGYVVSNGVIALWPDFHVILFMRAIQGALLPAVVGVSAALALRLAGAQRDAWAISRLNVGVVAVSIIGIPLCAQIAQGLRWSYSLALLAALAAVAAFALSKVVVREDRPIERLSGSALKAVLNQNFQLHLLVSFLVFSALFCAYSYITILLGDVLGAEDKWLASLLLIFGLSGVIGNNLAGRYAGHSLVATSFTVLALLAGAVSAIVLVQANILVLLVIVIAWGAAHSAAFVVTQLRMFREGKGAATVAMALNIASCNLGIATGAAVGAWSFEAFGPDGLLTATLGFLSVGAGLYSVVLTQRVLPNSLQPD
ncbi:MFS transporter [Marinobacter salsuginis]|uniref:MFS transporter n=1 Tax=Marinobacter salsuginis TaxID=418719 RepID=UPI001C94BBFA|nr:MFS transporter [Marinobacter salsuginis]MBY6071096.1 MFS transporter [Marinobacter salsuginis]